MASPVRAPILLPQRGRTAGSPGVLPALLLVNNFNGITPSGTTITTGNSGGVSGNAFETVNIGSGATVASSSTNAAHGSLAATISTGVTSTSAYVGWNTSVGIQPRLWFRGYYYFTANPAANLSIWRAFSRGTLAAGVLLLTTGQLRFVNTASATILTTSATVPLGQWFRIEGFVTGSATAGQVELKLFTIADSASPAETDTSSAAQNTFGPLTELRWGVTGNTANVAAFWEDDIGLSNTGYLGPASLAGPASRGQPESPVAAQIPKSPRQRGRVFTNTASGAPVNNPTAGPAVYPLHGPVRAKPPLPPRGRTYGNPGASAALRLVNDFNEGSNGTTLTQGSGGNTAGTGENFFSVVNIGTSATVTFDNAQPAHGSLGVNLTLPANTSSTAYLQWSATQVGIQPQVWFRFYLYLTAYPTVQTRLFTALNGATQCGALSISTTGHLVTGNTASAAVFTFTGVVPLNQQVRVEGFIIGNATAGQWQVQQFNVADSQVANEAQTSAATVSTLGPVTAIRFGASAAVTETSAWTVRMDDVGVSNTGYLGPASLVAAPSRGQPESPAAPQIPNGLRQRGRVASNAGAPVRNPTAGPVFQQATAPVRARLPQLQPRAGRAQGSAGTPVQNPTAGAPVYAPLGPVRARLPRLQPRAGRISSGPGAPVRNPGAGPLFQQATAPIRVRFPLLHPRAGRAAGNAGAPIANPTAGPVFRQATGPIRARIPQNWSKGRAAGNIGAPVQNPAAAQFAQLHKAVRAQPAVFLKGRARGNPGTSPPPPPPPSVGPAFYPLNHPAGNAYRAPGPFRKGRARGNAGAPVLNPAPVLTPGIVTISATGTVTAITPSGGLAATAVIAPVAGGAATVTITPAGPLAATVTTAPAPPGVAMVTVGGRGGEPDLAAGQLASEVQAPAGPPALLTIPAGALAPLPAAEQFTAEADGAPAP